VRKIVKTEVPSHRRNKGSMKWLYDLESGLVPSARQRVFNRDKQQIAAVSRAPGNLDLFVIGFDNRI
jgi:hypothetical protein